MSLTKCLLKTASVALLVVATSAVADQVKMENCFIAPDASCVDIIVDEVLVDLATDPERAEESDHAFRIANMLAHTPLLAQAEQVARLLPDGQRESSLEVIAVRHAVLGQLDEARRMMRDVTETRSLDSVRLEIVRNQMQKGDVDAARRELEEIETPPIRDGAISSMAESLMEKGNFEDTIKLSTRVADPHIRVFILGRVVALAGTPEHIQRAIDLVSQIEEPVGRVQGLIQFAAILAMQEKTQEAATLFEEIHETIDQLDFSDPEEQMLRENLNGRLIEAGFLDIALRALAQMKDVGARINLLTYVAHRYKEKGDTEKAEQLFRECVDLALDVNEPEARDKQLGFVLLRLSHTDIPLRERAHMIAEQIGDPKRRGETIRVLAQRIAELDRFAFAEQLLRQVDHQAMRIEGLMNLAWMLVQKKRTDRATVIFNDVVEEIGTSGGFDKLASRTREEVLNTARKLGEFEIAKNLASEIVTRDGRVTALSDIALAVINAGDREKGRAWLHEAVREADALVGGERRTDLIYRLSFRVDQIGGFDDIRAILDLIENSDGRQLFLYEVARHWLHVDGLQDDARKLVAQYGSADIKRLFREREREVALLKATRDEGRQQ